MPRDKTATHKKLVRCIREEFLEFGYEKASMKHIANKAGITAAGIYRHFPSKAAMFSVMVEPVTSEFLQSCDASMEETYSKLSDRDFIDHFNAFRAVKNTEFMNFIYDHYDVFRLLLISSEGTCYEGFEEKLIALEVKNIKDLFHVLEKRGIPHNDVSDRELHILCTTFITAACEALRHGYSREEALQHMNFVGKMLYPGMKEVLGF